MVRFFQIHKHPNNIKLKLRLAKAYLPQMSAVGISNHVCIYIYIRRPLRTFQTTVRTLKNNCFNKTIAAMSTEPRICKSSFQVFQKSQSPAQLATFSMHCFMHVKTGQRLQKYSWRYGYTSTHKIISISSVVVQQVRALPRNTSFRIYCPWITHSGFCIPLASFCTVLQDTAIQLGPLFQQTSFQVKAQYMLLQLL